LERSRSLLIWLFKSYFPPSGVSRLVSVAPQLKSYCDFPPPIALLWTASPILRFCGDLILNAPFPQFPPTERGALTTNSVYFLPIPPGWFCLDHHLSSHSFLNRPPPCSDPLSGFSGFPRRRRSQTAPPRSPPRPDARPRAQQKFINLLSFSPSTFPPSSTKPPRPATSDRVPISSPLPPREGVCSILMRGM